MFGRRTKGSDKAFSHMRGGYGSAQAIPLLDFDAIAETPKAFIGFSDITALHAFGIAIDVSSAEECTSSVNKNHASIWQSHGWYWGLAFCDPIHSVPLISANPVPRA